MKIDTYKLELQEYVQFKLNSVGTVKDEYSNFITVDILEGKIIPALTLATKDLHALNIKEDSAQFTSLIISLACYHLLISFSLKEKGREITVEDNGISFTPPRLADFLVNIAHMEFEKVKYIIEQAKKDERITKTVPTYIPTYIPTIQTTPKTIEDNSAWWNQTIGVGPQAIGVYDPNQFYSSGTVTISSSMGAGDLLINGSANGSITVNINDGYLSAGTINIASSDSVSLNYLYNY